MIGIVMSISMPMWLFTQRKGVQATRMFNHKGKSCKRETIVERDGFKWPQKKWWVPTLPLPYLGGSSLWSVVHSLSHSLFLHPLFPFTNFTYFLYSYLLYPSIAYQVHYVFVMVVYIYLLILSSLIPFTNPSPSIYPPASGERLYDLSQPQTLSLSPLLLQE